MEDNAILLLTGTVEKQASLYVGMPCMQLCKEGGMLLLKTDVGTKY